MALIDAVLWAHDGGGEVMSDDAGAVFYASADARSIMAQLVDNVGQGVKDLALQTQPHLVLLQDAFYSRRLKPLLARWMMLWLRSLPTMSHDISSSDGDASADADALCTAILAYLCGASARSRAAAVVRAGLSPASVQHVNLARDWLSTYLPHVLSKVWRSPVWVLSAMPQHILTVSACAVRSTALRTGYCNRLIWLTWAHNSEIACWRPCHAVV